MFSIRTKKLLDVATPLCKTLVSGSQEIGDGGVIEGKSVANQSAKGFLGLP